MAIREEINNLIDDLKEESAEIIDEIGVERAVRMLVDCEKLADILRTYIIRRKKPCQNQCNICGRVDGSHHSSCKNYVERL